MIELTLTVVVALLLLGLILGSFVNAMVWRFYNQEALKETISEVSHQKPGNKRDARLTKLQQELASLSMSKGRSMCSKCRHPLAARDLVPLGSWLWLRGKCRYCRQRIEDTPLLEAGLPVAFIVSYLLWPMQMNGYGLLAFVFWLVFVTGFAALTAYDIRWYLLPDRIVWPLVVLAVIQVLVYATVFGGGEQAVIKAFWGVVTASGIFWLLYRISGGKWIGGGDVKLGIVLGLLVGGPFEGLMVIFLASLLGSLASIPLLLHGKTGAKTIIPFGPFLMLAAFIVVLFGGQLSAAFERYILLV